MEAGCSSDAFDPYGEGSRFLQKCLYISTTVHGVISQWTVIWKSSCYRQPVVIVITDTEVRTEIHYTELYSNSNF
jgi:hypothetical protein